MIKESTLELEDVEEKYPLDFVRIYDFRLIPNHLLKQVKGTSFNWDRLIESSPMLHMNSCQLLYAMVDKDNVIFGVLWAEYDSINEWVYINAYSVDPDFQDGKLIDRGVEVLQEFVVDELESVNIKKFACATTRPKAMEKNGWRRSDAVLMVKNQMEI